MSRFPENGATVPSPSVKIVASARATISRRLLVAALAIGSAAMLACDRSAPVSVDLASELPKEPAYITGTIAEQTWTIYPNRLLVERTVGDMRTGAWVTLPPNTPVYWRDGRRGSLREVLAGRVVTVWVGGAELRSLPPQVSATTVVIER